MKVCIMGLGYIGLPTAAMFATHGVNVVGVDVNEYVINKLQNGSIHIEEPGLNEVVQEAISSKKLKISNIPEQADAFIIAVPTPFLHEEFGEYEGKKYKKADMSYVVSATEAILPFLQSGNLVILESTSPPRTTEDLIKPIVERTGFNAGEDIFLAYSPERVLPGRILIELKENARVIGGITPESAEKGRDLYLHFVKGEIALTDSTTAEMVKLMENTYRDVNIAIANEFSRLAERFGVDVWKAIKIANLHPRVEILHPGPGVGGHCISVDPWFLVEAAPDITNLIRVTREVNDFQPDFIVDLIKKILGSLQGKKIALLGLSYKSNIDDFRESPAIQVALILSKLGAIINAYEPTKPSVNTQGFVSTSTIFEALDQANLVVLLVDHDHFRELKPNEISLQVLEKKVLDTRNLWDENQWIKSGFQFFKLGNLEKFKDKVI